MASIRVALLQLVSAGRDLDANRAKGVSFCRRAATLGADVALFPEMWSVGYASFDAANTRDHAAWRALAVASDGAFVAEYAALARQTSMAIGVTYLERWNGAPRNALTLFDRHGEVVLHYAKTHLCPWGPPDTGCTPGDVFPVATLDTRAGAVQVGALICFDREFPEAARVLALQGAELILVPNACDLGPRAAAIGDLRLAQFRARAFESLAAAVMTNYASPQYDGHSVAFQPDGSTIALAGEVEEIVLADVDLHRVRAFRAAAAGRVAARRPDLYAVISDTKQR